MIRSLLAPPYIVGRPAWGILLLRCVIGLAFIFHGIPKIENPAGWQTAMMGPHAFAPPWLQLAATIAEFFGGIALILGFLTPLFALLILIDMATAILFVHLPMGGQFVGGPGSFEQPLTYLVAMIFFLLAGPGGVSLDAIFFSRRPSSLRR